MSSAAIDNDEAAELIQRLHDGFLQALHDLRLHLGALGKRTGREDSVLIAR